MNKHRRHLIFLIIIACLSALALLWSIWFFKVSRHRLDWHDLAARKNFWGITYSKRFASYLNLPWRDLYLAILDELKVKNIRLPLYWQDLEPSEGNYEFADYDWLLDESAKRGTKVIAVIGRRLPRWPECQVPDWAKNLPEETIRQKTLALMQMIIERYKNRPEIIAWQVENEFFLDSFGVCPPSDPAWLAQEIALVKSLDSRPILMTASGELSSWRREAKAGDIFGTTLYRVVWSPFFGYWRWPLPVSFYQFKLKLVGESLDEALIAELQAEPWAPNSPLDKLTPSEAAASFDLEQLQDNLQFAVNTGFKQAYLWGVEWWYLEKLRGRPQFWEEIKRLNW